MKKAKVNQEVCIGCGTCAALCPQVFQLSAEIGKAEVKAEADFSACELQEVVDSCPAQAISLVVEE